jgi:2,4-didehydro-3-deoxy-L-rhamnonate hydrolase
MKLFRFGKPGEEKAGLISTDGKKIDVSAFGENFTGTFYATDGLRRLGQWYEENQSIVPEVDNTVRLGPVVCNPSKIVCIGLNYYQHAKEAGMKVPQQPEVFLKATSSLAGPNDDLIIPKNSSKTDWEVELAIVINRKASYIEKSEALSYVAGYALMNDYSEREFQFEQGGQWDKGKSCDTFAPLGPFLVTPEECSDVHNLNMWLSVNGAIKQQGKTSDMIFDIPTIISYLSQYMTLLPGDVISTGTPPGVGFGLNPPQYLQPGDVIEFGIDGLGVCKQKAVHHRF